MSSFLFIFHVSSLYAVAIIGIYKPIHNRFIHANLRLNLGWFGWIFTSPQFHRVHHSIEPEHADKNFGVYFSIYDYLFRTACLSRNLYPETGIADHHFPDEEKVCVVQPPQNWMMQTIYPFTQASHKFCTMIRLNLSPAHAISKWEKEFKAKNHHPTERASEFLIISPGFSYLPLVSNGEAGSPFLL